MNESFDIQKYMTEGVEKVVSEAIKATLKSPRESAFMLNLLPPAGRPQKSAERLRTTANISLRFL